MIGLRQHASIFLGYTNYFFVVYNLAIFE